MKNREGNKGGEEEKNKGTPKVEQGEVDSPGRERSANWKWGYDASASPQAGRPLTEEESKGLTKGGEFSAKSPKAGEQAGAPEVEQGEVDSPGRERSAFRKWDYNESGSPRAGTPLTEEESKGLTKGGEFSAKSPKAGEQAGAPQVEVGIVNVSVFKVRRTNYAGEDITPDSQVADPSEKKSSNPTGSKSSGNKR